MNKHTTAFYWIFGFVAGCVVLAAMGSVQNEEEASNIKQVTCMADNANQTTRSMYVDGVARCIVEEHMTTHERVALLNLKGI